MTSNDVFLGGGTSSGSIVSAELPNIVGKFTYLYGHGNSSFSGAISGKNIENSGYRGGHAGLFVIDLNASLYNPIYKDNGKLIPKHYIVEYWIKYK